MTLADALTLLAFGLFVAAAFVLAVWAGLIALGLVVLILGLALSDGRGVPWRADRS